MAPLPREHALDRQREARPGLLLFGYGLSAAPGDGVEFRLPVILRNTPTGGDRSVELEAIERRVEGPFLHLQHFVRKEVNGLSDGISVHRAALQRVQDQQIERALQKIRESGFAHRPRAPMTV